MITINDPAWRPDLVRRAAALATDDQVYCAMHKLVHPGPVNTLSENVDYRLHVRARAVTDEMLSDITRLATRRPVFVALGDVLDPARPVGPGE